LFNFLIPSLYRCATAAPQGIKNVMIMFFCLTAYLTHFCEYIFYNAGIFYGHLVKIIANWYFCGHLAYFSPFYNVYQEKSGIPEVCYVDFEKSTRFIVHLFRYIHTWCFQVEDLKVIDPASIREASPDQKFAKI
jgi:hypothetical protein